MKDQAKAMNKVYVLQIKVELEAQRTINTINMEYARMVKKERDRNEAME